MTGIDLQLPPARRYCNVCRSPIADDRRMASCASCGGRSYRRYEEDLWQHWRHRRWYLGTAISLT